MQVQCTAPDRGGKGDTSILLGPGDSFGAAALTRKHVPNAAIVARSAVALLQITDAAFESAFGSLALLHAQVRCTSVCSRCTSVLFMLH